MVARSFFYVCVAVLEIVSVCVCESVCLFSVFELVCVCLLVWLLVCLCLFGCARM